MAALVGARIEDGAKMWFVWGASGNDKWERQYPQCRSKTDFYETLREELELPTGASRKEVFRTLLHKTWSQGRWQDDFAILLKAWRKKRGLTRTALAQMAGLSVQAVSAVEQGKRSPSWDTVRRLALALEMNVSEFQEPLPPEPLRRALQEVES
jgi:DNA-binding XRE family transcriptional regulator